MGNTAVAQAALSIAGIKQCLERTYRSKFVRNVAVVALGTAEAQAIVTAFSPIITRLYGPEAFGIPRLQGIMGRLEVTICDIKMGA